jgi:hypothetical protein
MSFGSFISGAVAVCFSEAVMAERLVKPVRVLIESGLTYYAL